MSHLLMDTNKKLLCMEYPGNVESVHNMIKTLGGINNMSAVYSDKKRRMELRFRPDDIYCKPVCGDRHKTSGILFKISVKRKKKSGEIKNCNDEVAGVIDSVYKFTSLCDFQYLPIKKDKLIYDDIVPKGLLDINWLYEDSEVFLPPAAYSRIDSMQSYHYRNNVQDKCSNKISFLRKPRYIGMAYFIAWNDTEVPNAPKEIPTHLQINKCINENHLNELKKKFEQRPIWSKHALFNCLKIHRDQLKLLLPLVAYYFTTGPWRVMWVKYGYDPRKDPSAKIYQTLDYRLPTAGGLKTKVFAKRSHTNYILPYKSSPITRPKTPVISIENNVQHHSNQKTTLENDHIFRSGMIPPSRQMFYQYCDLQIPEIQDMLTKLPQPTSEAKCDEKMGWLPKGMDLQCRQIIHDKALETFHMMRKTDTSEMPNISLPDDGSDNSEHFDSDYEDTDDEMEIEKH